MPQRFKFHTKSSGQTGKQNWTIILNVKSLTKLTYKNVTTKYVVWHLLYISQKLKLKSDFFKKIKVYIIHTDSGLLKKYAQITTSMQYNFFKNFKAI